jgi:hypothetical protein
MSSCVVVSCTQGFVISTDTIAFKVVKDERGKTVGNLKAATRKLFQLSDDLVVAGVGEWTSYFPIFNAVAGKPLPTLKMVAELRQLCSEKAADSRVFILYRTEGEVFLDVSELGHLRLKEPGSVAYPVDILNALWSTVYESPQVQQIRKTGMLGIAAVVNAYNAFASALTSELSPPFDTVCFLNSGLFAVTGGVTRLPVTDFW